jgi:ribosomal-protein-serine acetyltransferase
MLGYAVTDTVFLGPLEPWQADEFLAHTERGRDFLGPWLPWVDNVVDEAGALAFLRRYADLHQRDAGHIFGLRDDGHLVGGLVFRTFDVAAGTAELGVWLEPAATGRGLITRAADVLIEWAFRTRGIQRIEWLAATTNQASIRVAERLGMTREGVMRSAFPHRGERPDLEVWALLAEEHRGPVDPVAREERGDQ